MTGTKNVYRYITTEGKRAGKEVKVLDYLQKNTGVFNGAGMISADEVKEMQRRAKENKGNIWHGFISLSEEDSIKINTPEKCIALINSTFKIFLKDAKLNPDNIDLMCALHLDRPHHLHIHFVFWEKEPKYKGKDYKLHYRRRGKIEKEAIDRMFVRLGLAVSASRDRIYKSRDMAIRELRGMTNVKRAMTSGEEVKKKILALAKALPEKGRLAYASKDMEPYRGRVDEIVQMLLNSDGKARRADMRFYAALEEKKREIANICGRPFVFSDKNMPMDRLEAALPQYHNTIDGNQIRIAEEIESDYKRRQGNLVLKLAKFIKPEFYERKSGKQYRANDNRLKKRLMISRRKVGRAMDKFFSSFGAESERLGQEFIDRLREIEEEIARERDKKNKSEQEKEENYKY